MEQNNLTMEILLKNNRQELMVKDDAVFEEYEEILNYLMKELNLKDVTEIDNFDERYRLLEYEGYVMVLYYSIYLGISVYFDNQDTDHIIQKKILNHFLQTLQNMC